MTENDAIELLNASYIVDAAGDVDRRRIKLEEFLISALKEIQQYREIGASPERITELILEGSAAKRILQHYQKIGTVEECREAVEKRKVFCDSAEKCADGKCVGYGKSEIDDEPCEICKRCNFYVGYGELESEEE